MQSKAEKLHPIHWKKLLCLFPKLIFIQVSVENVVFILRLCLTHSKAKEVLAKSLLTRSLQQTSPHYQPILSLDPSPLPTATARQEDKLLPRVASQPPDIERFPSGC